MQPLAERWKLLEIAPQGCHFLHEHSQDAICNAEAAMASRGDNNAKQVPFTDMQCRLFGHSTAICDILVMRNTADGKVLIVVITYDGYLRVRRFRRAKRLGSALEVRRAENATAIAVVLITEMRSHQHDGGSIPGGIDQC
jgi:hypothetical protein